MNLLPPSRFTWEKYIGKLGIALSEVFSGTFPYSDRLRPEVTVIGFCPAKDIRIRSRPEGAVVMVELNGEEFWFHQSAI